MEIKKKIDNILINALNINKKEINENMHFDNVASWDSLAHIQLINEIESEFNIQLDISEISEAIDYTSIKLIVLKHLKKREL